LNLTWPRSNNSLGLASGQDLEKLAGQGNPAQVRVGPTGRFSNAKARMPLSRVRPGDLGPAGQVVRGSLGDSQGTSHQGSADSKERGVSVDTKEFKFRSLRKLLT